MKRLAVLMKRNEQSWSAGIKKNDQGKTDPSRGREENTPEARLLGLQSSAGNRATARLLGRGAAGGAVQPKTGKQIPDSVREKMESHFKADFSGVRVHEGHEAPSLGALAFTQRENIYFSPGRYSPHSQPGQDLLGHELTHVVQQREGRVPMPGGGKSPVVINPALEAEADRTGALAARSTKGSGLSVQLKKNLHAGK